MALAVLHIELHMQKVKRFSAGDKAQYINVQGKLLNYFRKKYDCF